VLSAPPLALYRQSHFRGSIRRRARACSWPIRFHPTFQATTKVGPYPAAAVLLGGLTFETASAVGTEYGRSHRIAVAQLTCNNRQTPSGPPASSTDVPRTADQLTKPAVTPLALPLTRPKSVTCFGLTPFFRRAAELAGEEAELADETERDRL